MDLAGIDRLSISSFNALVVKKKVTKNEEAVDSCGRFSVRNYNQVCLPMHFIPIRLLFMKKKPLFTTPEELLSTKSECFVNI